MEIGATNILLKIAFQGNVYFITPQQFTEMKAKYPLENFELLEVKTK